MAAKPYSERQETKRGAVEVFDQAGDSRYFVRIIPTGERGYTYAAGESDAPSSNVPDELMAWGLAKLAGSSLAEDS